MNEQKMSSDKQLVKQDYLNILEDNEEAALEKAKTHWLLGEWEALVALDIKVFSNYVKRDRFAILVASACQHLAKHSDAKKYTRLALDWGCPQHLVARVLIADVHNTLGRMSALKQDDDRVEKHFLNSVELNKKDTLYHFYMRSIKEVTDCKKKIVRKIHTFLNGIKVYDEQLIPAQRMRYAKHNVHKAEEEDVFIELLSTLSNSSCFVNIGSAIGYYIFLAKKLMPNLTVHAVEPLLKHQQFCYENLILNEFNPSDFIFHRKAVCSTIGFTSFLKASYGSSVVRTTTNEVQKKNIIQVPSITLDSLVRNVNSDIDLLQMDVQGLEVDVLKSGLASLSDNKVKTFLIGTHSQQLHEDCMKLLTQYNYEIEFDKFDTKLQPDGILVASKGVKRLGLVKNDINAVQQECKRIRRISNSQLIFSINRIKKEGFWFVDIPRTSSSSIKAELGSVFGAAYAKLNIKDYGYGKKSMLPDHLLAKDMKELLGEDCWNNLFSFTFVRNPWDRAVSLYLYRKRLEKNILDMEFKDYVIALYKHLTKQENSLFAYHGYSLSASDFILDDDENVIIDYVGKYENRNEDINYISRKIGCRTLGNLCLQKANKENTHYSQFYDDESREIIEEIYQKDIELFKYSFEKN
jgi:FkbM family methyltransferase